MDEITRGDPKQIADADGVGDGSIPFYVEASVRNAGPATLSDAPVPLNAVDTSGDRLRAVEVSERLLDGTDAT